MGGWGWVGLGGWVSRVFQGCFKEVSKKFQGSFKSVSREFKGISHKFQGLQGYFKEFQWKFQKSFKCVEKVFQEGFKGIFRKLVRCFNFCIAYLNKKN